MKSYSFATKNLEDFDLDRVLAEDPDSDVVVVVGPVEVQVWIKSTWLAQFLDLDHLMLAGEALVSNWGYPRGLYRTRNPAKEDLAGVLAEVAAARKHLAERRFKV